MRGGTDGCGAGVGGWLFCFGAFWDCEMTNLPPDLAAFASLLDAQPEPVRAAFADCLAVAVA